MTKKGSLKQRVLMALLVALTIGTIATTAPSAHADGCTKPPTQCGGG